MEYEVESIEGDKYVRGRGGRRVRKYLVHWVGFLEPTWEPATNLTGCADKLAAYNARSRPSVSASPPTPQPLPVRSKDPHAEGVDNEGRDRTPSVRQRDHGNGKKDSAVDNSDGDDDSGGEVDYYANVYDADYQPEDIAEGNRSEEEEMKESSESRQKDTISGSSKTLTKATLSRSKASTIGKSGISRKPKPPPKVHKVTRPTPTPPTATLDRSAGGSDHSDSEAFLQSDGASSASDYVFSSDDASDSAGSNGDDIETIVVVDQADSDEDVLDDAPLAELSTVELRKMADDGFVDAYQDRIDHSHMRLQTYAKKLPR